MKLLVLCCLVALVAAAPPPSRYYSRDNVELLRYTNENSRFGSHKYSFEQSDGTRQEQEGKLRNKGLENEFYEVKGSYSWVGPDNVRYTVTYVADENGYQPDIEEGPGGLPVDVVCSICG